MANDKLSIVYQNVRGLRTKTKDFFLATSSSDYNVVAISETWLTSSFLDNELFSSDFCVYRSDRNPLSSRGKRGGGVMLGIKNCPFYTCEQIIIPDLDIDVDLVCAKLSLTNGKKVFICCVYIPSNSTDLVYNMYFKNIEKFCSISCSNSNINNSVVIMGDFNFPNISWVQDADNNSIYSPVNVSSNIEEVIIYGLHSYGLSQWNGVTNFRGRILDLIFCNSCDDVVLNKCDLPLLAIDLDHPALELLVNIDLSTTLDSFPRMSEFSVFNFKKANYCALNVFLQSIDWDNKFRQCSNNCNDLVDVLYDVLFTGFQQFVPLAKRSLTSHPPWYNRQLLHLKYLKNKAHKKYKRSSKLSDKSAYCSLRRSFSSKQSSLYRNYINDIQSDLTRDPSKFWQFVNLKRKVSGYPSGMSYKDKTAISTQETCDLFASFFESVYTVHSTDDRSLPCFGLSSVLDIGSINLIIDDVLFGLNALDANKGSGPDHIPPLFLKNCSDELAKPLLFIFQKSLLLGQFPCRWKTSYITPVFKSGSRKNIENYRGIAILPTLGKLFESIVCNSITNDVKRIVSINQHGFTSGRSTTTNLLEFSNIAIGVLESGAQVDVVYTDFSKAFDRVHHKFLVAKLSELGFHSSILQWLQSYLIGRYQYIKINGFNSSSFKVHSGVPQGSHLGPLLFNLFINDVVNVFDSSKCLLYADDIKIFGAVRSVDDVSRIQLDIDRLTAWCDLNCLSLNVSKCKSVSYHRTRNPIISSYNINDIVLDKLDGIKDLGVFFDHKLTFVRHIEIITSKAYSMLGFVMRICNEFTCPKAFKSLYFAYVRSQLEYCSSIWFPYYDTHSARIESIQKKFLRYLFFKFGWLSYIERAPYDFKRSLIGIPSLAIRRRNSCAFFIFDLLSGRIEAVNILSKINFNAPSRTFRNNCLLRHTFHRTNYGKSEPINNMCHIFNEFSYLFDFCMSRDRFRMDLVKTDLALLNTN